MGRAAGRGWMIALPACVTLTALPAAASASGPNAASASPKLAKVAHAAFWQCHAKTTVLLVVVNTLTLHPGSTLNVAYTVRNGGTSSCDYTAPYAGVAPGPTSATLTAGPCGSVGYRIEDRRHHTVWPGNQVVNCPALGFAQLAPGATVSGTGSWDQTRPNSTRRVPPGNYTLIVDDKQFTFPLRVSAS
jgi:hypothetical protein